MGQSAGAPRGAQCPLPSSSSRTLEISLKSIKARNVSLPCNSLSGQCCRRPGQHLLFGGGGARPICAQPRVGSHPIPAVEEEAGSKEGTPANRQLSARASEKGGHCEEAEAEGKASSSCSSEESVPELQAG